MTHELLLLAGTAALLGSVHTLLGPDHYLPFIALSKARGWSSRRTLWITALCGLGHVAGSAALGLVGVAFGLTLKNLEVFESQRGEIAGWLLIGFGFSYFSWGMVRAFRRRPHEHAHAHSDGTTHVHRHSHHAGHVHPHDVDRRRATPWVLFIIFVFGPCEPLIPLLMYPAATSSLWAVLAVVAVFGAVTVATMTGVVWLSTLGLGWVSSERLTRFGHSVAGATIFLCGLAVHLGL